VSEFARPVGCVEPINARRLTRPSLCVVLCSLLFVGTAAHAQSPNGRWALTPFACDGEAFTRAETPLLVEALSVRWFNANCTAASNYKVNQTLYLQGRCNIEGRTETIPIMLEPRGDRLRVGWNREPVQEMQRCKSPWKPGSVPDSRPGGRQ
jgi:hypothetical protein